MTTTDTTWPEGVIARYLTVGGATVDVRTDNADARMENSECVGAGCNYHLNYGNSEYIRQDAQRHAEKCRAMPKPTTS